MTRKQTISFLGAGALASGLAQLLGAQGYAVGEILSRPAAASRRRAAQLARAVNARACTLAEASLECDVLWLAVPDGTIAAVAAELARRKQLPRIVLHASGALSSQALAPVAARGVHTGSAHPLMTFVKGAPPSLAGAWFALEGATAAVRAARGMATALGAHCFTIAQQQKALYHAFGAMLSPMLAAEMEAAARLGARVGLSRQKLRRLMQPIVERTVANVLAQGAARSFSGPLARGDVRTVKMHLEALRGLPEEKVYRALAAYATEALPVGRRNEMKTLLGSGEIRKARRTN